MNSSEVCLNPQTVIGPDGPITYSCGSCLVCIGKRNSMWRSKLNYALDACQYPVFITLTYANQHLPKVYYDEDKHFVTDLVHTNGSGELVSLFDEWKEKYTIQHQKFNFNDAPHYVSERHHNDFIFNGDPCFAICLKKDIQDFIKRVRTNLKRHSLSLGRDHSFTYFICSEYGPKTFRPHYHGVLFFNDHAIAQLFERQLCESSWKKSDKCSNSNREPIAKAIYNKSGAAAYVSKYITSVSDLPFALRDRLFKPFYLFSKGTPIGCEAFPFSNFYDKISLCSFDDHVSYVDKQSGERVELDLPLPSSAFDRVFPRLLFHGLLDPSQIRQIIRRIYQFAGRKIPNTTDEVYNKFHIGDSVNNSPIIQPTKLWKTDHIDYHYHDGHWTKIHYRKQVSKGFAHHENADNWHTVVYSDYVDQLTHPSNLDLFLFGIPQNRTFAYKLKRLIETSRDIAATPFLYEYYYNRFNSIQFSSHFKKRVDELNESFNYYGNICIQYFTDNYSDFYNSLPNDYEAICSEDKDRYNRILLYGFSMSLRDFYDDSGKLFLRTTIRKSKLISERRESVLQKQRKHKATRTFNAFINNDL